MPATAAGYKADKDQSSWPRKCFQSLESHAQPLQILGAVEKAGLGVGLGLEWETDLETWLTQRLSRWSAPAPSLGPRAKTQGPETEAASGFCRKLVPKSSAIPEAQVT